MRLGRVLSRWAVALYPRPWRDRYGGELRDLLDDVGPRFSDALDLMRGAVNEHRREINRRRSDMGGFGRWVGHALSVVGLLLIGWSAAFVISNVARYNLGAPLPGAEWVLGTASGLGDLLGVAGPAVVGTMLAVAGSAQLRSEAGPDGAAVVLRLRASPVSSIVAGLGVLVLAVLAAYGISENLLEALRR